jgi:hypothetical protein
MRTLIVLAILVATPVAATEVYRWVDAQGQVHFSDQWRPGAERVRIVETQGFTAPPPASAGAEPSTAAPVAAYRVLEIISPAQEEVLWNIEGQLPVSLQVDPTLRAGHTLRLLLDGQERNLPPGSTSTRLSEVFRGVHTLQAQVLDANGKVLIESPTRTFVVRQTSIANPQRPIRP